MPIDLPQIHPDSFARFRDGLTENDIYRFDTTQDGDLRPQDFTDNDTNWQEYACRFVRSNNSLRSLYRNKMSQNLKIELSWELFRLWQSSTLGGAEKERIAEVIKRDFKVRVNEITDRESVVDKFFSISNWSGANSEFDYENDLANNIRGWSADGGAYAETDLPLRLQGDHLLFSFNPNGSTYYVNGKRTIENEEGENIIEPFEYGSFRTGGGLSLSDLEDETWWINANGQFKYRTIELSGFRKSDYNGRVGADLNQPWETPFSMSTSADLERQIYTEPLLANEYQQYKERYNGSALMAFNLSSMWAAAASYRYRFRDDVYRRSTEHKEQHTGNLHLKRRTIENNVSAGVSITHANVAKKEIKGLDEHGAFIEKAYENINMVAGIWGSFFTFLGVDEFGTDQSVECEFALSAVKSTGDLDAWYPSAYASISGSAYLMKGVLQASLTGEGSLDYIDRESKGVRYDHNVWYSMNPSFKLFIADDINLELSGLFSRNEEKGGFNTMSTTLAGGASLGFSFDVQDGLNLRIYADGGRYINRDLDQDVDWEDSVFANCGAELQISY